MKWLPSFLQPRPALPLLLKSNPLGAAFLVTYPAQFNSRDYRAFSEEGYKKNAILHRCVNILSKGVASIKIDVFQHTVNNGKSGRKKVTDLHPLKRLIEKPNPMMGGSRFLEYLTAYFLIAGNAYIIPNNVKTPLKQPTELWLGRPDYFKVFPGTKGFPTRYEYAANGTTLTYPVDQLSGRAPLLHMKSFNPLDEFVGISRLSAASEATDVNNSVNHWNYSLLENGARPSGALINTTKDGSGNTVAISPEQQGQLSEMIGSKRAGPWNAGRPIVLDGGWDWKEMQLTPKEMDYINSKHTSARDICCAMEVPSQLLNVPGDSTYANYEQARLALWQDSILPLMDMLLADLNNWLSPLYGPDVFIAYDENSISALAAIRKQQFDMLNASTFLTINEKREQLGFETIEGGDKLDSGIQPIDLSEPPLPDEEAPPEPPADTEDKAGYLEWLLRELKLDPKKAVEMAERWAAAHDRQ